MASENVHVFNDMNFENEVLQSGETVLVDFTAAWCGPCKRLSPIVEEVAEDCDVHAPRSVVQREDGHAATPRVLDRDAINDARDIHGLVLRIEAAQRGASEAAQLDHVAIHSAKRFGNPRQTRAGMAPAVTAAKAASTLHKVHPHPPPGQNPAN